MTKELKEKKKAFAENQLQDLARAINNDVLYVRYKAEGPNEYISIHFANMYTEHINVTCDSLAAMAMDVIRSFL